MRISGNLCQITWKQTSGGTDVADGSAVNMAEASGWNFDCDYEVDDTTVLASDSPRLDICMRRTSPITVEIWANDGALPAGIQRLPAKTSAGVHPSAYYLRLILDKNTVADNYIEATAYLVSVRIAARAKGGRKVQYALTFLPTGVLTQVVSGASSATIR